MFYFSVAEPTVGILTTSLPIYIPLIRAIRRKLGWDTSNSQHSFDPHAVQPRPSPIKTFGFRPWGGKHQTTDVSFLTVPDAHATRKDDESDTYKLMEVPSSAGEDSDRVRVEKDVSVVSTPRQEDV
jgi:hypothetical protein